MKMAYRQPKNDEGLLRLNLQFFAEGGEGGQGGQGPTPSDGGEQNPDPQEPQKTFTQEDVNGIVAKEAKKAQEKLLKQLGIDDFNTAKEGLQKFKEWQESQKTEAQRQAEKLQDLEKNYSTVSEENASLKAQISAMKAGVHADYVEDVVTLAKHLVNDEITIEDAIGKVVEKYPHFKEAQHQQEQKPAFSTGQHQKPSGGEPTTLAEALAQRFTKQ